MYSHKKSLQGLIGWMVFSILLLGWGSSNAIAGWFGTGGGGTGGFTGRPLITIEISADKIQLPLNLVGMGPDPTLPYTSTVTVVVKRDGRLYPANITIDMVGIAQDGLDTRGALYYLQENSDPLDKSPTPECIQFSNSNNTVIADNSYNYYRCRQLSLYSTSGITRSMFTSGSQTGQVTIIASAQDPSTFQTVSAELTINIVDDRPDGGRPTAMTFAGNYVQAVLSGRSRFNEDGCDTDCRLPDGNYSRLINVDVNDINGNPVTPNTRVDFFLIDGPITGYPGTPGRFFVAGNNSDPQEGAFAFHAEDGKFVSREVRANQHLILDGRQLIPTPDNPLQDNNFLTGLRFVERVIDEKNLTIRSIPTQSTGRPFNMRDDQKNTGPTVPYIIGRAQHGTILSPAFTNIKGGASTLLTYPLSRVGQTAVIVACVNDPTRLNDRQLCAILNTCDANGANCQSVYLGSTSARTLTVSETNLGPNRTTSVRMCLRDADNTPLPVTSIDYNVSLVGAAKVNINTTAGNQGSILTDQDGCAVVSITSSGQKPGSQPIDLQFTTQHLIQPVKITIRSPGNGFLSGLFNDCEFKRDKGTAICKGSLRLTDDEGSPMEGALIALGKVEAAAVFDVTFSPSEGVLGKTDAQGLVQVTLDLKGPGSYSFPFQTASGGTAQFTFNIGVPAPGELTISFIGEQSGTVGVQYSAVVQASGGIPPYKWELTGQLPGLSFNSSTGIISGLPNKVGTFSFAVKATDSEGRTGFSAFSLKITAEDVQETTLEIGIETDSMTATIGVPYSAVLWAAGGKSPYTWTTTPTAGQLPDGLVIDANGAISGTPTTVGAFSFAVQVTDANGVKGVGVLTIVVEEDTGTSGGGTATGLSITTTTLPEGVKDAFYTTLLEASGGKAPYTWSLFSGTWPSGIDIKKGDSANKYVSVALEGKPTVEGIFSLILQITDTKGAIARKPLTLIVNAADGTDSTPPVLSDKLELLTQVGELKSSDQEPLDLTATTRNSGGNLLKGAIVTFSVVKNDTLATDGSGAAKCDGDEATTQECEGTIRVIRNITDDTGTAIAELTAGGNKRNRTIIVQAAALGADGRPNYSFVKVKVTGTTLTITGLPAAAQKGDMVPLTFSLQDSSSRPIPNAILRVKSGSNGLALLPGTSTAEGNTIDVVTNMTGTATVNLSLNQIGGDSIDASWDGLFGALRYATSTTLPASLSVSDDVFLVEASLADAEENPLYVPLETPATVTVTWKKNGEPVSQATIALSINKGFFFLGDKDAGTKHTGITDTNGKLTGIQIKSIVPGGARISATGTSGSETATGSTTVVFYANTTSQLTLQANPATIGVNTSNSTAEQSTVIATLRDSNFNPIENQIVFFTVTKDVSGGTLSDTSAKTGANGQATVIYTAGANPTDENGVKITATIVDRATGKSLTKEVGITVARKQVFVKLGTGNTIIESKEDPTIYEVPYNVLVNDMVGGAVNGAKVTLNVVPSQYQKGQYYWDEFNQIWVLVVAATCQNEDTNANGILDPGEDYNGNGRLDPGNVITTKSPDSVQLGTVITGADGFGRFNVLYAQQYANWIIARLSARTQVGGSEGEDIANFQLGISADDVSKRNASPPGNPSPFGVLSQCVFSVEAESGLQLVSIPEKQLQIKVPDGYLAASGSVSGTVKVQVKIPNIAPEDLSSTAVFARSSATLPNIDVSVPTQSNTASDVTYFPITVRNTDTQNGLVIDKKGTAVGSVTFTVSLINIVVNIELIPAD